MTAWAVVVQGLYWLLVVDAVLAMLTCTLGLAWCVAQAAKSVLRACRPRVPEAGDQETPVDGPPTVPLALPRRWKAS